MNLPKTIAIENTNHCNLACVLCDNPKMKRNKGFMQITQYKKLIDEIKIFVQEIDLSINAEPLLHPDIVEMVKYAHNSGLETRLGSNAILLEKYAVDLVKAGLDYTNLSFDGMTRETYEKYRQSINPEINNFEKVKLGLAALCNAKKNLGSATPHVQISFLVNKYNEHEISDLLDWSRKIGVNTVLLKAMHFYWTDSKKDFEQAKKDWLPKNKKYWRIFSKETLPPCQWADELSVVLWDGRLGTCCNDIKGINTFENVFELGFKKAWINKWKSQNNTDIRNRNLPMCQGCSEGISQYGTFESVNQTPLYNRLILKLKRENNRFFKKLVRHKYEVDYQKKETVKN